MLLSKTLQILEPSNKPVLNIEVEPWLNKDDNSQVGGKRMCHAILNPQEHLLISNTALNGGAKTCTRLIKRSKIVREKFFLILCIRYVDRYFIYEI